MSRGVSFLFFLLFLIPSGCATIIKPQELRGITQEKAALTQVVKSPEAYKGRTVLWGGRILRAVNKKGGTMIEILQLPLDSSDRPKDVDTSGGRFLVMYPGYLDVAIYRPGREITVAGKVQGIRKLPLGEIEYDYPLLKASKIHLWKVRPETIEVHHEYWPYPYCYPCWWAYPYW